MVNSVLDLKDKKVIVVGIGASGRSAASLLTHLGAQVIVTDRAVADELPSSVRNMAVQFVLGGHTGVDFLGADLIVVSPGIPPFDALLEAEAAGVEVIGEVELAARYLKAPLLAVGGTNGKSTVTTLLGHMMESAFDRVFIGGNLGDPACDAALQPLDAVIFEVSSFQMERLDQFHPHVACLLNVSEDHLDRYESYEHYVKTKGNCFLRQNKKDFAIFSNVDPRTLEQSSRGQGRPLSFGPGGDYFVKGSNVVKKQTGDIFPLQRTDLYGQHNFENAAAAIAMADAFGLSTSAIKEGLLRFRALPHRMALAGRYQGVSFYDDSKATNVGSAVTALKGLSENKGVLIAGGKDKFGDFSPLVDAIKERARGVVLLGEASERLQKAIDGAVPTEEARSMQGAVARAYRMAQKGDAVLLSPACSSFDLFKSYVDRGERFTQAVLELPQLLKKDAQ